jgi:hypothetical protein
MDRNSTRGEQVLKTMLAHFGQFRRLTKGKPVLL